MSLFLMVLQGNTQQITYCNPLNIDYGYTPIPAFATVFGKGSGRPPGAVNELVVLRTQKDKRSAWLKWIAVDNAYAYNIYMGTQPGKLYNNIMPHSVNEYYYKGMDKDKPYYFQIEAINENGISKRSEVIRAD